MQFDRAEPQTPEAPPVCARCGGILSGTYYAVRGRSLCASCGEALRGGAAQGYNGLRFLKASLTGIAAVFIGGGFNWFVASRWDLYVGWLALLAGVAVGHAVRWGSGNRGGRPYQVLAMLLAYLATAAMFIPVMATREGTLTLSLAMQPLWILLLAPFVSGLQGILLWFILGISMLQAWRLNRSAAVEVRGPYPLGSTLPPQGSGGV